MYDGHTVYLQDNEYETSRIVRAGEARLTDDSIQLAVPPPRNLRHVLRVIGWNLLFILAGLLLIWIAGEAYWRLDGRFGDVSVDLGNRPDHWRFVPGVGLLRPPQGDLVFSNGKRLWTVQRANSLGFLDREPISATRAAESCHVTIIGDSFVEGREVYISDKLQVHLEEIATREVPHLDVTTTAFGIQHTGQLNQLPFYDRYARRMNPDLVVLVFTRNDPNDNSPAWYALKPGHVPNRLPYGQASRDGNGGVRWLPPVVDFSDVTFSRATESLNLWIRRPIYRVAQASYFVRWLYIRTRLISGNEEVYERFRPTEDSVRRYHEWMRLEQQKGTTDDDIEAWGFTSLGLEQFKRRADHDGFALLILANYDIGGQSDRDLVFAKLSAISESLGIPVVSQKDYIVMHGGDVYDAHWIPDYHWTPAGHRWAAEAIWEYMKTEWQGKCPEVEPQPDVHVDWVAVGETVNELENEYMIRVLQKPFGLQHRIHTPQGEAWVQRFPALDSEKYRSVRDSVASIRPIARSDWNVHLYDEGLTYVREPCAAGDVEKSFFLHVFPEDKSHLPTEWQAIGFTNLDFYFGIRGAMFDGICMVSVDLPEYDIARIRTGQFDDGDEIWKVDYNFDLQEIRESFGEFRQVAQEPDIRSNFDVYLYNDQLIYVKESCDADDRDLPFFLHVFPANENELPAGRKEAGFDNLDFELMQKGGESDDACFAAVDLPKYKIDYIKTGQFVRGDGSVWEASIEFAE